MKTPTHYKMPKSKAEAKERGSMYYIDGKVCRNGHSSSRYRDSGKCVACAKANKEKHKYNDVIDNARQRIEKLKESSDFEESWE